MSSNHSAERVAIVTGASSGIGQEAALELARRGYIVALAARRTDRLAAIARQCEQLSSRPAVAIATDVAEAEQVHAMVKQVVDRFGRLDVLVNNAGYGIFSRVHETSPEQMRRIFDVNFFGLFYGCQAAVPIMIRQRSGHIMNVSSVIGKRGTPFHGAYCATKFAVAGLTESLRVEMKPYNIRVTLVCPALTETEFFSLSDDGGAARSSFVKFKKLMSAGAVARKMIGAVGRNKPEIVFTAGGKFLTLVSALSPRFGDLMMGMYHDDLVKNLRHDEPQNIEQ